MPFHERLLRRIEHQEQAPQEHRSQDLAQEIASILDHLHRLLNTRQGSVPILDDYGIPDFTNLSGSNLTEAAQDLQVILRQVIEHYEPRLCRVQVSFDPAGLDSTCLWLKVEAVLTGDAGLSLALDATVYPQGRVLVQI
jgi:type VI secretion system protein